MQAAAHGYDAHGRPAWTVEAPGTLWQRSHRYEYDARDMLTREVHPRAYLAPLHLLGEGEPVGPAVGVVTEHRYDVLGRRAATVEAANASPAELGHAPPVAHAFYDAAGRVVLELGPARTDGPEPYARAAYSVYHPLHAGSVAEAGEGYWDYDAPPGAELTVWRYATSAYDGAGNRTLQTTGLAGAFSPLPAHPSTTLALYDALNRPVEVTAGYGTAERSTTATGYFIDSSVAVRVTGIGDGAADHASESRFWYDALGRVTVAVQGYGTPEQAEAQYEYDAQGNLFAAVTGLAAVNPHPVTTGYYTDPLGRVTDVFEAVGTPLERRTHTDHDPLDRVTAVTTGLSATNPHEATTVFGYDPLGRRTAVVEAYGTAWERTTATVYNADDTAYQVTDPRGIITRFGSDALGRTRAVTEAWDWPGFERTTLSDYDASGNLVRVADPAGSVTLLGHDVLGQRTEELVQFLDATGQPVAQAWLSGYDAAGNVRWRMDPLAQQTDYGYDAHGRLVSITDPRSGVTAFGYDAAGNRVSVTDPGNNTTLFGYDAHNRLTATTDPLGKASTREYDSQGLLVRATDRLGRSRVFGHDDLLRPTSEAWYDPLGGLVQTQSFAYDAADNLLSASDPDGSYSFAPYTALGQPTTVTGPYGSLTFGYDAAGNRTLVQDSLGGVQTSGYDPLNRLAWREFSQGGVNQLRWTQTYTVQDDPDVQTRYAWGGADWAQVGATDRGYDQKGRPSAITHANAWGSPLAEYAYTYDLADRLASKTEDGVPHSYGYDAADQLTQDGAEAFGYDLAGNRTNAGYVTGPGNRLLSDGEWGYTYDAEGNLTKKVRAADGLTWTYAYDHRNQMTRAEERQTDGGALLRRVDYAYDAFGNRIRRAEYDGALNLVSDERYAVDGWRPGGGFRGNENFDAWADVDANGNLVMRRLYGDGFDSVAARLDGSGNAAWYLPDHLGSVRLVVDNTGTALGAAGYTAFGEVVGGPPSGYPTGSDRYGYAGREYDPATGLYHYRARDYDPATGRFGSEDPLGADADVNLYRYVRNSPTNATDPSGMEEYRYSRNPLLRRLPDPPPPPPVIIPSMDDLALQYFKSKGMAQAIRLSPEELGALEQQLGIDLRSALRATPEPLVVHFNPDGSVQEPEFRVYSPDPELSRIEWQRQEQYRAWLWEEQQRRGRPLVRRYASGPYKGMIVNADLPGQRLENDVRRLFRPLGLSTQDENYLVETFIDETHKVVSVVASLPPLAQGVGELAVGVLLLETPTGVSQVAGAALVAMGVDRIVTWTEVVSGHNPHARPAVSAWTYRGLRGLGMRPETADGLATAVDVFASLGIAGGGAFAALRATAPRVAPGIGSTGRISLGPVRTVPNPANPYNWSNERLQLSVMEIHEAAFGTGKGGGFPITLTVTPEGRVILTQVAKKPSPAAVAKAEEIFRQGKVEVFGRGAGTNAPGVRGRDAEARGIHYLGPDARMAKQFSSHNACEFCEERQLLEGIINPTGTAAREGKGQIKIPGSHYDKRK